MEHLIIPENYSSALNLHDTQIGIKTVKDFFQSLLVRHLNLLRVSAPLFVDPASGMNDNLNGYERPVSFGISLLLISSPVQKRIFSVTQEKTGFARGFSGLLLFVAILCVHAAVYDGGGINNPASPCTSYI